MPRPSVRGPWPRGAARPWVAIAAAAGLFVTVAPAFHPTAASAAPVAPELVAQVEAAEEGEPVQALVMLPNVADLGGDREDVLETLREHATGTQAEVEESLHDTATVVNRFWITNMLLVEFPSTPATLDALLTSWNPPVRAGAGST